jgi:hypothetical protein
MIPFLFLGLLETALRVFDYGESQPEVFVTDKIDNDYLYLNPLVGQRYFPVKEFATTGPYDVFLKNKTDSTIRIFVQGASSSAGFPFYAASFPRLLEQKLSHYYSNNNVEVVNASLVATNSFTLLDFAQDIIAQKPNMVIIYAGHNEYYGALGVGSSQSFAGSTFFTNLYIKLRDVRLVQLIKGIVKSAPQPNAAEDRQTLMAKMVKEESIVYGSKAYQAGIDQYKSNMGSLLSTYQKAGIPVFICTLVSNVKDFVPFESTVEGEFNAEAAFQKGRKELKEGKTNDAKISLTNAKDFDLLRFRAPTAIEEAIPELAKNYGTEVIDMKSAFEKKSNEGIIGNDLLLEHVHANLRGQRLFADVAFASVAEFLEQQGIAIKSPDFEFSYAIASMDSLYGNQLMDRLLMDWPFVDEPMAQPKKSEPETLDLILSGSLSLYEILNNSFTTDLSENPGQALKTARVLMQEYPNQAKSYLLVADAYTKLGDVKAAGFVLSRIPKRLLTLDVKKRVLTNLIEQSEYRQAMPLANEVLSEQSDRYNQRMVQSLESIIEYYQKQPSEVDMLESPDLAIKALEALIFLKKDNESKELNQLLLRLSPKNEALLIINRISFN